MDDVEGGERGRGGSGFGLRFGVGVPRPGVGWCNTKSWAEAR